VEIISGAVGGNRAWQLVWRRGETIHTGVKQKGHILERGKNREKRAGGSSVRG